MVCLCGTFSSSSLISFELPGTFQSAHTSHVAKRREERGRQRQREREAGAEAAGHSLRQLKWSRSRSRRRRRRRRRQSVAYVENEARLDFSRRIVLLKLFTQ